MVKLDGKAVVYDLDACLGITLHQGLDVSEQMFLYERWSDRRTFTGSHAKTEHLQAFIAGTAQFLAGPPEMSFRDAIDA